MNEPSKFGQDNSSLGSDDILLKCHNFKEGYECNWFKKEKKKCWLLIK